MKTPILGSSYVARTVNAADARMVNLFPEMVPEGGKEPAFLQRTPGMVDYYNVGPGPIRGLYNINVSGVDVLFIVSGTELHVKGYGSGSYGTIRGTYPVFFAFDGRYVAIAALNSFQEVYLFDTDTFTFSTVSTGMSISGGTVTYIDGFMVYAGSVNNISQKVFCSNLLDPTTFDPLNFASAEGMPDGVIAAIANNRELWVFGTKTTEVWVNAGSPGFPFAPLPGAFNEVGCVSAASVGKLDNSLFWLGQDDRGKGIVYRNNGYRAERVSTHAIEWQIQRYSTISDAIAYTYQQDGHAFYVLTFPTADATWVYDVATQAWHERASYEDGAFHRHRSNCQTTHEGDILVGDFQSNVISVLDPDTYLDNGLPIRWLRSWRALGTGLNTLKRSAHHSLQLDCDGGDAVQPGSASLRWSDDGGYTWSIPQERFLGSDHRRIIWRRLGMTTKLRDRVYEVSGVDANRMFIMGAELLSSATNA